MDRIQRDFDLTAMMHLTCVNATKAELNQLWPRGGLLLFRDLDVTPELHIGLSRVFGDLIVEQQSDGLGATPDGEVGPAFDRMLDTIDGFSKPLIAMPMAARPVLLVDRSTSMYVITSAVDSDQARLRARPRPFWSRCTTPTSSGNRSARPRAISSVRSFDALLAMMIFQRYGQCLPRYSRSLVMLCSSTTSSL